MPDVTSTTRTRFLLATLITGAQVLGEFSKLAKVQRYVLQVFGGTKPFNAWTVVAGSHPVSGEPVLMRQRQMVNGDQVVSVREVQRKADASPTSYALADFEPVTEVQRGEAGVFIAPDGTAAIPGVVPGTVFPVHRDANTLRKYIVLRWDEDPAQRLVHDIDVEPTLPGHSAEAFGHGPGDGDDDDFGDDD